MELVHLFEVALHGRGFLDGAHEGQHDIEVLAAKNTPGQLEGFDFPVVNVAGNAPVAEHRVIFVSLEEVAAEQISILVGFEIRGAVKHRLAMEGHGKKPEALGQGLDVEFLAGAEAPGEELLANFLRQGAEIFDLVFDADLSGHFHAHGLDLGQGILDDGFVGHSGGAFLDPGLEFQAAFDRVGITGPFLELIPTAKHDGDVGFEIRRSFEHIEATRGLLHMVVELLVQLADVAMHGHDFVGAPAGVIGQGVEFGGQPRDEADVTAQFDLHVDETGRQLLAHDFVELGVDFLDFFFDELGQRPVVVGLQGLGVDTDVAEHEFGAQQPDFKILDVAQP